MSKPTPRYIVNAIGKSGQTYMTHCQNKSELKKWIEKHEDDLIMDALMVTDKHKHPLLRLFSFNK